MFRYETSKDRVLPFRRFLRRMIECVLFSGMLLLGALIAGVAGYHFIAGFAWIDALLNAAMILTGMGPVGALDTVAAKLFASAYALFSGLVFVTAMAITMSPIFHRVLHQFHLDDEDFQKDR